MQGLITLILSVRLCDLLHPSKGIRQMTLFFSNYAEKFPDFQVCLILEDRTGNAEESFFSATASVVAGYLFADQTNNKCLLTAKFWPREKPEMDLLEHFHLGLQTRSLLPQRDPVRIILKRRSAEVTFCCSVRYK